MKFTKLSLIAALAVTATFAGESTIGGDVKLFYGTTDAGQTDIGTVAVPNLVDNKLFNKGGAIGDAAVSLDYSRGVADGVTLNAGLTGVSTLGLEKDLVSQTWINHGGSTGVNDVVWLDTANIAVNVAKTTAVIGRQELDTPFLKSEKWNIVANTFDAAVLVNQDIQDTTLVAAWVGRGNGTAGQTVALDGQHFQGGMTSFEGGSHPAYAVGAVTTAIPMTTFQVWGYKIPQVATAQWVQADIAATPEVSVGLQYAGTKLTGDGTKTSAVAGKLGYAADGLTVSGAYSKRDDKAAGVDIANIATGHTTREDITTGYTTGSESNLYTEAYWNHGLVGAQGAKAFAIAAGYDLGAAKVGARYVNSDSTVNEKDLSETTLTVGTAVGPVNAELAYINAKVGTGDNTNTVLVMLTAPFSL
jgi:hypothetical protein